MSHPELLFDVSRMRMDQMHREAATARLAASVSRSGPRPEARILLPLADRIIALGLRLRRHYQPGEALALVPIAHLPASPAHPFGGADSRANTLLPVFAFQVIQCLPQSQRAASLTYWSLLPATSGAPEAAGGLGLLCLPRSIE